MSRSIGTVVRGVRAPIIRQGDDIVDITVNSVLTAIRENGITPNDRDVVAVTESVVARSQGNYANVFCKFHNSYGLRFKLLNLYIYYQPLFCLRLLHFNSSLFGIGP